MTAVAIVREDPRRPDVARLVRDLDAYMATLYPAESNHLLDLDTLAADGVVFLVARLDGAAAGCAALLCHDADFGEIKRVWVDPARRGSGIARRLIEALEAEARTRGLARLRLETGTGQPEALQLFARHAFARCGAFGDYPADDPYSVFMEKPLA